jgi:hypothetical protein
MIQMTSAEVMADILKMFRDLVPLLTEKNIDKTLAGLAEAKETVAKAKEIQADILASDERLAEAKKLEAINAEQDKTLSIAAANLGNYNLELGKREADVALREQEVKAEADKLAKAIALYEKKDAKLTQTLAKAESDAKEIETAKEAITAKLAKLAEVA